MAIKLNRNMVRIYCAGAASPKYYFKRKDLANSRIEDGYEISEWIDHLQKKNWTGKSDLYNLAVLIQKEFPGNTINWERTFYPVEKQGFIDELYEEYQRSNISQDEAKSSLFDVLKIKLKLGIEIENEGKEVVAKKLKDNLELYGL